MKSRVIVSKGRAFSFVLIGNDGGFGFPGKFLFAWHVAQPCTYAEMSSFMSGHQKSCDTSQTIFVIPGCPAVLDRDTGKLPPSLTQCCPQRLVLCLSTSTFLFFQPVQLLPLLRACLGLFVFV